MIVIISAPTDGGLAVCQAVWASHVASRCVFYTHSTPMEKLTWLRVGGLRFQDVQDLNF